MDGTGSPGQVEPPAGWPAFLSGQDKPVSRGGLFDDDKLMSTMAPSMAAVTNESWRASSAGQAYSPMPLSEPAFSRAELGYPWEPEDVKRSEVPLMAFVDRASIPGFQDKDEYDSQFQLSPRHRDWTQTAPKPAAQMPAIASGAGHAATAPSRTSDQEWEVDLLAWKQKYGCPDVPAAEPVAPAATTGQMSQEAVATQQAVVSAALAEHMIANQAKGVQQAAVGAALAEHMITTQVQSQPQARPQHATTATFGAASAPHKQQAMSSNVVVRDPRDLGDFDPRDEVAPGMTVTDAKNSVRGKVLRTTTTDVELQTADGRSHWSEIEDIRIGNGTATVVDAEIGMEVTDTKQNIRGTVLKRTATDVQLKLEDGQVRWSDIEDIKAQGVINATVGMKVTDSRQHIGGVVRQRTATDVEVRARDGSLHWCNVEDVQVFDGSATTVAGAALAEHMMATQVQSQPQAQPQAQPQYATTSTICAASAPQQQNMPFAPQDQTSQTFPDVTPAPASPQPAALVPTAPPGQPSDRPGSRRGRTHAAAAIVAVAEEEAASPTSRKNMYSEQELEAATTSARSKAGASSGWASDFTEGGLQMRDFLQDLKKSRDREKGRQASGPLWLHLAATAKNMADKLNFSQLVEVLKLFCSVRYEDYELYMRLLGEVPHYIKEANAEQLCQLIRLLSRRRLRERNYVDMVVAHLLEKIRVTQDTLATRLLVKTANGLAALECRSQPKFVEHFNRHLEHRIDELDAELCCMVSPVFMANYMSDALRRSYLKRCAETHAGFQGPEYELRNVACSELVLRKELHSFVASLPPFVCRYLDKVRAHADFDKWGSVVLPTTVAPDGPKGGERQELNLSLLRKASTATGGRSGDVFSSEMHRDVSACLTHLGIEHENGAVSGPYLIDVVAKDMVNPTRRIIFEVNAPHHFYEGTQTLVAEKRLRHRMLGRLGLKLHMVNAADWRPLTAAAKMAFLLKMQQEQQDKHSEEYKQEAAANTARSKLPAIRFDSAKQPEPLKLKFVKDLSAPISVPVPPSQRRPRPPMTAR